MNEAAYRASEARLWSSYQRSPDEHWVRLPVTGRRVRVLEVGRGDPVLFVHGGPNAGSTWAPLVARLAGFRCLMVDRPGTGLSEPVPTRPADIPELGARFVAEVLDGLGIARAHVVASSFGGHLALRSAARTPDRFVRMVQMACPALVPGDRVPPFMKQLTNPLIRWIAAHGRPSRARGDDVLRQIGHGASLDAGRLPEAIGDWYLDLQRYTDTRKHDFAAIAGLVRDPGTARLTREDFAAARVPTLFLWGEDDAFGDEAVARDIAGWMPDAELEMLPASGHLPWLDAPDGLAGRVAAYLRQEVDAPARPVGATG